MMHHRTNMSTMDNFSEQVKTYCEHHALPGSEQKIKWTEILEAFPRMSDLITKVINLNLGETIEETMSGFEGPRDFGDAINSLNRVEPMTPEQSTVLREEDVFSFLDGLHWYKGCEK